MQVNYSRIKVIYDKESIRKGINKEDYERLVWGLKLDFNNLYISEIIGDEIGLAIYIDTNYFKYESNSTWDVRRDIESTEELKTLFKSSLLLIAANIKYGFSYVHLVFLNSDDNRPIVLNKLYDWKGKKEAILLAITPKLDIFSNYLFNKPFTELLDKVEITEEGVNETSLHIQNKSNLKLNLILGLKDEPVTINMRLESQGQYQAILTNKET